MHFAEQKSITRKPIEARNVLNEAYDYDKPAPFTRGLRVEVPANSTFLYISGTASVGPNGESLHLGDFDAQAWRTFNNIKTLLEAEGATWQDIIRTTCYLRDIERDYDAFNQIRKDFYDQEGLNPYPASTGIQAILCRPELLIEIEAIAVLPPREQE